MKFVRLSVLATLGLAFAGCATPVKLDPAAANIEVVDYIKPELREKLVEVDQVKCQLGENARSRNANIEGCKNTLKNAAAKMGGRLVLIKDGEPERYELSGTQKALTGITVCENCVIMNGIVFKDKDMTAAAAAPVEAPKATATAPAKKKTKK